MKNYNSSDFKNLSKLFQKFIPVFVLAAILPFLIGFLVSPPEVGFFTRADTTEELRIWLEPANVVMSPGSEATLTVVASYEGENKLIPEVSLFVKGDELLEVPNPMVTYGVPFSGREEIGTVTVRALSEGKAEVTISEDTVEITAFDEDIDITTGVSNIVVR